MVDDSSNDPFIFRRALELSKHCTILENYTVMVASWNVNGSVEEACNLNPWLKLKGSSFLPDIAVIGLQELISLSATNVVGSSVTKTMSNESAAQWTDILGAYFDDVVSPVQSGEESIPEEGKDDNVDRSPYVLVASEVMVGVWIAMYVRSWVVPHVSGVLCGEMATGVGGMLGNKGGLGIRMKLHDSTICFVTSHLTAHRDNAEKRNEDFKDILNAKMFSPDSHPLPKVPSGSRATNTVRLKESVRELRGRGRSILESMDALDAEHGIAGTLLPKRIDSLAVHPAIQQNVVPDAAFSPDDHDIIFWCGDLNYRMRMSVTIDEVYDLLAQDRLDDLAEFDQLNAERDSERAFAGFHEGMLMFPPTYKYIVGTNSYDRRPDKKQRCPAWCDRILWRCGPTTSTARRDMPLSLSELFEEPVEAVQLMVYDGVTESSPSVPPLVISDHKPVRAIFSVRLKK